MTSIAPDAGTAEPTLAEAFGELAAGIVEAEDNGGSATPAPSEAPAVADAKAAPDARAAADVPDAKAAPVADAKAAPAPVAAAEQEAGDDPLAGSKPLAYTVNGESRTFDGIHEYEGGGAVILADALPRVKDRLQQADRLVEQNRELYQQTQTFERLGGVKGIEQLRAERAILDVSGTLLLKALSDENTLITLATDPAARAQLIREVQLSAREAQLNASREFQQETVKHTEQQAQAGQTQTAIGNAVAQLARNFAGLTTDDVAAVRNHALRVQSAIVRPANPDEARAAGVRVGESIIDLPTLHQFLADRHALRQSASANVKRDADAARDNAARLAAAAPTAAGRPAAPRPGAGKVTQKEAKKTLDQMTSAEITRAMKTGRIFDLMGGDE